MVAILLGVLVLGESITVTVLAGIALVLAGVALTRRRTVGNGQIRSECGESPEASIELPSRARQCRTLADVLAGGNQMYPVTIAAVLQAELGCTVTRQTS